jgi:catechol 2,3-dioxygenase-like lactoylglutathione lyase family enzyme
VAEPRAGAIHHLALRVRDPAASAAFYSGVLGLPELRRNEEDGRLRSIWVRAGEAVLMLERAIKAPGPETGSGHVLALEVADLEAWTERLTEQGHPPVERTASTLYVLDPDGHRVGLTAYPREQLLARG